MSSGPAEERAVHAVSRRSRRRLGKAVPIAVFLVATGFILKEQIPAVDSWITRIFQPEAWQAIEACRQAAITAVERPDFARILEGGEAKATQKGYYVDNIVLGEMGARGSEVRSSFSCYVNTNGGVANTHRQPQRNFAWPLPVWTVSAAGTASSETTVTQGGDKRLKVSSTPV